MHPKGPVKHFPDGQNDPVTIPMSGSINKYVMGGLVVLCLAHAITVTVLTETICKDEVMVTASYWLDLPGTNSTSTGVLRKVEWGRMSAFQLLRFSSFVNFFVTAWVFWYGEAVTSVFGVFDINVCTVDSAFFGAALVSSLGFISGLVDYAQWLPNVWLSLAATAFAVVAAMNAYWGTTNVQNTQMTALKMKHFTPTAFCVLFAFASTFTIIINHAGSRNRPAMTYVALVGGVVVTISEKFMHAWLNYAKTNNLQIERLLMFVMLVVGTQLCIFSLH